MKFIKLKVYDIVGNEVATLVNKEQPTGSYEIEFDTRSYGGSNLPSGIYCYQLVVGDFTQTKKLVILK